MDFKQIQELIKMINKSNIGEVSIEEKGFTLTIKQTEAPVQQVCAAPVQQPQPMTTMAAPQVAAAAQTGRMPPATEAAKAVEAPADNTITIKKSDDRHFLSQLIPG